MSADSYINLLPFSILNDNDDVFTHNASTNGRLTTAAMLNAHTSPTNNSDIQPCANSDRCISDYNVNIDPDNIFNEFVLNCKYYDNLQFNILSKENTTGLSIIHFNARSLNANFEQIKDFLQTLDITFDVVAISEMWVEVGNATDYDLLNYHAFHTERCHKKGGGVAIIYVNNRF